MAMMLHNLFNKLTGNSENEANDDSVKNAKNTSASDTTSPDNPTTSFTTQKEILQEEVQGCKQDKVCQQEVKEFCSQLANLYAEYATTGKPDVDTFMEGSHHQIYEAMKEERKKQIDMIENREDYLHPGFAHVKYEVETPPLTELDTVEKAKEHLNNNHVLLTVPVSGNKTHQMYFGKESNTNDTNCVLVDANAKGGKTQGKCDSYYRLFSEKFADLENKMGTDKTVTIAKSDAPIHQRNMP